MRVTVEAAAKINLLLDIRGRFANGYHDLYMIMQSVGLFDRVTVEQVNGSGIVLACSEKDIPCDERNTAYKAAEEFFRFTGIANSGIQIYIEKHIPHEAGLAGGSADAAAVIRGLDRIYQTQLRERDMCAIGVRVGADVPFCIMGGTMIAQGVGDILTPIADIPDCTFVLAKPAAGVSTAQAYAQYDAAGSCRRQDEEGMLAAIKGGDLYLIARKLGNSFEQLIDTPKRVELKSKLREGGAIGSCMSGSGPTVFGIFDNPKKGECCATQLKQIVPHVFVCHPVKVGCKILKSE